MSGYRFFNAYARRWATPTAALSLILLAACGSGDDDSPAESNGPGGGAAGQAGGSGGEAGGSAGTGSAGTSAHGGSSAQAGAGASSGSGGSGGLTDAGPTDAPTDGDTGTDDASPEADAAPSASVDCDRIIALGADLASAVSDADKVMLVEQYLLDLEKSDGLPVRCTPNATFFFRLPAGWGPPHVAGDFNGWDPAAAPMVHLAEDLYSVTLPVDTGPHRYLYKFTDGTHWTADPMARRFGYDGYGEYSLVQGGEQQGHLERHFGIAGNGLPSRRLTIYLPPGYESSAQDYPVLYAHDGQNLFDPGAPWGGWRLSETLETLLANGEIQPLVVVGVHNTSARFDEYTHVQDIVSGQTVGGMGESYFGLVRTRVMPLVESHYRVLTGPAHTWTMGSSLGGLISLYFGLQHPDVFGRVAGMSSTLGWGSIGASNPTLIELLPSYGSPNITIYLDSGGNDGGGCIDSDGDGIEDDAPAASDNYCETVQMRDALAAAGYAYDVDLFHWHEPDANHDEAAWAARVELPLKVLAAP